MRDFVVHDERRARYDRDAAGILHDLVQLQSFTLVGCVWRLGLEKEDACPFRSCESERSEDGGEERRRTFEEAEDCEGLEGRVVGEESCLAQAKLSVPTTD